LIVDLADVSGFFDDTVFKDAYGTATFKGQIDPFQLFTVDGAKVVRRSASVLPGVQIPPRRTVKVGRQVYLIGDETDDHFDGEEIRTNFVLMGANFLATVRSIPDALADAPGLQAWVSRDWNKDEIDSRDSAQRISQYHLFFSRTENIPKQAVIEIDGLTYFVKETHRALSGLTDALSNELEGPVYETVSYGTRTYNAVTDTYSSAPTSVRVLRLRWQEAFKYLTQGSTDYERGDQILMMLKAGSPTPKTADIVPLSDGGFRVLGFKDEGLHWSIHARRA